MPIKSVLWTEYGKEDVDTGINYMVCPHCDPERRFDTLPQWKAHMQREHGGYTSSEVSAGQVETEQTGGSAEVAKKPKKLSAKSRELNDKLNRSISIIVKHIVSSISEDERAELERNRADITQAVMGIEIDFEESGKLFQVSGKFAIILVLSLLYVLPQMPSLKEFIAKAREKKERDKKPAHAGEEVSN